MPTYEYECAGCGHEFEEFQSITSEALKTCPKCRKNKLRRLIGAGAGLIFKGSGFYLTDYRSEGYKRAAEAEKKAAESKSAAGQAGESKSTASDGAGTKPAESKGADAAASNPRAADSAAPKHTPPAATARGAARRPATPAKSAGGAKKRR